MLQLRGEVDYMVMILEGVGGLGLVLILCQFHIKSQ